MPRLPHPDDVLRGKVKPQPRTLVDLIATCNPTGRGLSASETARRYATKSALQSLLVRWYGDSFLAEPDVVEGIVLLRHRHFDECACHARVADLDDGARAWVYHNLEQRAAAVLTAHAPAKVGGKPRTSPLAAGHAALAEFDYEAAESHYRGALHEPALAVPAARALLELWVDTLACDALAVALSLTDAQLADLDVQALLGIASARTGDLERALRHAQGLDHPRAGDVEVLVGLGALAAGDIERARLCLALAKLRQGTLVTPLADALAARLKARAADDEARLAELSVSDPEQAETLAHRLLDGGHDSPAARQLIRARSAQRKAHEAAQVEAKRRRFEAERQRQDELRLAEQAAHEEQILAAALAVATPVSAADIDALVALSPPLAQRVRSLRPDLAPLVDIALAAARLAAPRRVATVALAAWDALVLWHDQGEAAAEEVVDRLLSVPELESRPRLSPAFDDALKAARRRVDARISGLLEDVESALRVRDYTGCLELCLSLQRLPLAPEQMKLVAQLEATMTTQTARQRRLRAADGEDAPLHVCFDALLAARELADVSTHLSILGPSDQLADADMVSLAEQRVARALDLVMYSGPELPEPVHEDEQGWSVRSARVHDGCYYFFAAPEGRAWITVVRCTPASEDGPSITTTVKRFSLALGASRRGFDIGVAGGTLWIVVNDGGVIVLDCEDPTRVKAVVPPRANCIVERVALEPMGTCLAMEVEGAERVIRLIDVRGQQLKVLPCAAAFGWFVDADGRALLLTGATSKQMWAVFNAEGTLVADEQSFMPPRAPRGFASLVPMQILQHPAGQCLVALAWDLARLPSTGDFLPAEVELHLVTMSFDFVPRARVATGPARGGAGAFMVMGGDQSDALVELTREGAPTLARYDLADLTLRDEYTLVLGARPSLRSNYGRMRGGVVRDNEHLRLTLFPEHFHQWLGRSPPAFIGESLSSHAACSTEPDQFASRIHRGVADEGLAQGHARAFHGGHKKKQLAVNHASLRLNSTLRQVTKALGAKHQLMLFPCELAPKTHQADFFTAASYVLRYQPGDAAVAALLREAVTHYPADPGAQAHALHLLGLNRWQAGDTAGAEAAWREGLAGPPASCPFELILLAIGATDIESLAGLATHADHYRQAREVIAALDAHRARGEGEAAWAAAREARRLVGPSWQLHARVVELHLDFPELDADPWRRELDLAWLASGAWAHGALCGMSLGPLDRDHTVHEALSERARSALGWLSKAS